jgi:hypothetical protein
VIVISSEELRSSHAPLVVDGDGENRIVCVDARVDVLLA